MTTTSSSSSLLTLQNRTALVRKLCPYHYLVREDFFFGTREGLTPREEIHRHIRTEIMPQSMTVLAYDVIGSQPLPWMQERGYSQGYAYLLFYCTEHDPFLQKCFMDQTSWLYRQHTTPEEQAHVQPDREQYEALRALVQDSMHTHDLVDRAEQMPIHEHEPATMPEFIIRRRGTQQDIVPAAPLPPTPAPLPAPTKPAQRKQYEQEEPDEAKNFLIKERELMNLISGWRGRER